MDLISDGYESRTIWHWNWTELCGYRDGIIPINPETHNIGVCFQQLCLQIPVLALLAIISAYYCGRWSQYWIRDQCSIHVINIRIVITVCLALLPIIRAYIILSNTTFSLTNNGSNSEARINMPNVENYIANQTIFKQDWKYNDTSSYQKTGETFYDLDKSLQHIFIDKRKAENAYSSYGSSPVNNNLKNTTLFKDRRIKLFTEFFPADAAKPIDYFVAGTEGLAWFIHLCFLMSLRRGGGANTRGPILIRILIFLLIGISSLLLRSHVIKKPQDDVLPNLSLGFSISSVILLALYCFSLAPGKISTSRSTRLTRYNEAGERTALLSSPSSSYVTFIEEQDTSYLGIAMEGVTIFSKLVFHWVTPLMEKGSKGLLNHTDDLYDLPEHVSTSVITSEIDKQLQDMPLQEESRAATTSQNEDYVTITATNKISLLKLLFRCLGWQFFSVGILKFVSDCSGFAAPILLNRFIGFIEDKQEPISHGYIYVLFMFLTALVGAFFNVHFTFWMSVVGLKIRSSIVTLVYTKTVHSPNMKLHQTFTFGEIINFMSTDTDRIVNSCASFHTFWSIPFQLIVTLYLLHSQIGISFLAGVFFTIILIPINKLISNKIGKLSTKMMGSKDERLQLMGEILRGIVTIKLNVWEERFMKNISKFRDKELKYLRRRKYLDALCVYFWATTPILIALFTFSTYVLLGNSLNAKTVFTTMALLNMLIGPLNTFPWVLNGLTEAWVSIKRVQKLFDLPDIDTQNYYTTPLDDTDVMLSNASFSVSGSKKEKEDSYTPELKDLASPSRTVMFEDESVFALKHLNLTIQKGQFIGITGKVGSGKTQLLNAILSEIVKIRGIVAVRNVNSGFGYVSQNPWVQRGTIKENILFGKTYDYIKYTNVLKACALLEDLNTFPAQDMTCIGDAGSTLSGGQKTRIALARAVYADKDIYLLDDILATLDPNVARNVFQNVILGLLKNKTRILCTHQTKFLFHANFVVEMSRGQIIKQGNPSDILPDLEDYLLSAESINSFGEVSLVDDFKNESNKMEKNEDDGMFSEETMEKGNLQFGVLTTYFKAIGKYLLASIFLSIILMQSSKNVSDVWLSYWVTHNEPDVNHSSLIHQDELPSKWNLDNDIKYYFMVYGILAFVNSVFTLIRAFIFAYGGLQAAIIMHKQLLKIVMRGKLTFFDLQPHGRIMNRFSSDTYTVDDSLPFIANILCAQLFGLLGVVIVTSYSLPWTILVIVSLVPCYNWIQNRYRLTSRELKRLSSVTLSPLYTHFNETLQGLSSIRAFRVVPRFKHDNDMYLEASQKAQFASIAASQWLSLRLQLIGAVLLGTVCLLAAIQHQYDKSNAGLTGLAITYILSISGMLSAVVNAFTETEREMIAVERIKQYLEHVPAENLSGDSPPYAWPSQGVVKFDNVVLKYRDHLPPSLKNISFVIRPAEKIGIVGRTGAGKSSILSALFRLTEITSGEISIDNVNIQSLQLEALRSRLSIIPQNPFLFSGTIRENVDPLNQYPDIQIYKALEKCSIHGLVSRLGGLGAVLDEGGSNLSKGQRQLFCLVRAVLHNARILCIDEATANVDQDTDRAIQATIKFSFRSCTVITIAHRIRTIMHCDRVMVMGDGEILEFEEPNILLQNTNSYFYNLVSQEYMEQGQ